MYLVTLISLLVCLLGFSPVFAAPAPTTMTVTRPSSTITSTVPTGPSSLVVAVSLVNPPVITQTATVSVAPSVQLTSPMMVITQTATVTVAPPLQLTSPMMISMAAPLPVTVTKALPPVAPVQACQWGLHICGANASMTCHNKSQCCEGCRDGECRWWYLSRKAIQNNIQLNHGCEGAFGGWCLNFHSGANECGRALLVDMTDMGQLYAQTTRAATPSYVAVTVITLAHGPRPPRLFGTLLVATLMPAVPAVSLQVSFGKMLATSKLQPTPGWL
ncbi:MAG: hypothetical protein Q9216_004433 [Gyalolechia sp. 2 TL-2023]